MSIASPWWRNLWCPNHDATSRFTFMFCSNQIKRWLFLKFNHWTLCVKIGKYDLSKLNVNNLQGYWTVTEKSCFKTKSLWRKVCITDSQQISDFLVLKITQKICGAVRTNIILFTLIMDRIKGRKIVFGYSAGLIMKRVMVQVSL